MNSQLIQKKKTDEFVIYNYSADTAHHGYYDNKGNVVFPSITEMADGEIKVYFEPRGYEILKLATYDENGYHAEKVAKHLYDIVFNEGMPEEEFIAWG